VSCLWDHRTAPPDGTVSPAPFAPHKNRQPVVDSRTGRLCRMTPYGPPFAPLTSRRKPVRTRFTSAGRSSISPWDWMFRLRLPLRGSRSTVGRFPCDARWGDLGRVSRDGRPSGRLSQVKRITEAKTINDTQGRALCLAHKGDCVTTGRRAIRPFPALGRYTQGSDPNSTPLATDKPALSVVKYWAAQTPPSLELAAALFVHTGGGQPCP